MGRRSSTGCLWLGSPSCVTISLVLTCAPSPSLPPLSDTHVCALPHTPPHTPPWLPTWLHTPCLHTPHLHAPHG